MNEKWIEHIKSVTLVSLVILSFVLSGFLWYSAPTYKGNKPEYPLPPYPFDDGKYNQKSIYQLISPFQMIVHHPTKTSWLLPENSTYEQLLDTIREAKLRDTTFIQPSPEDWKKLYQQSMGVEFLFTHDQSLSVLDPYFKDSLRQDAVLNRLNQISRICFFIDPQSQLLHVWFISDQEQKIVQAKVEYEDSKLEQLFVDANQKSTVQLSLVSSDGKLPWEATPENVPFSRVFYIPEQPLAVNEAVYSTGKYEIDHMQQWLFRDPGLEPILLNKNESVYMYNDQLLTSYKDGNFMVYNDARSKSQLNVVPIGDELIQVNNFMQRHRGWSGNYLLDKVTLDPEDYNQYTFRLFVLGYPIYWKSSSIDSVVHLDQIHLRSGTNGVSKYSRSLYYLKGEPTLTASQLPSKNELLQSLKEKKVPLKSIERVLPGYQAHFMNKDNQVKLEPVWVIYTNTQDSPFFFNSSSKRGG
ncbi:two-component system activity regulator YycH [Hazenella coriacea]|uniref:Regulatory protein YycH of two-component signal transduction system YycFG n=1 Tax=Hazenella coriacea TaxID=1179467 RepID=A0A4R3L790_9BACL|nr:two-component system activity regulator YycH [Hazenella coriacea]TCS95519.1 regulatory protein YycH of two-component signal transduction system YycFG [Hazenella coriacea]